jgi:hypothetical protein
MYEDLRYVNSSSNPSLKDPGRDIVPISSAVFSSTYTEVEASVAPTSIFIFLLSMDPQFKVVL